MSHITTPHPAELPAPVPDPAAAAARADGTEPTITESVATTLTGMVVGGAAIWFLAPICFVC
ncbi:MAG: hypothetical protein ACLGIZ_14705 [Acidimicrobiia bacterium]